MLKSGNYAVENLFAGCACCTLSGSVPGYIQKIQRELNPEWLIFESTGVGYPASIQRTIQNVLGLDSKICIIVDAKRWIRIEKPLEQLLSGQFENADVVLINKKDLVDQETLVRVITSRGSQSAGREADTPQRDRADHRGDVERNIGVNMIFLLSAADSGQFFI